MGWRARAGKLDPSMAGFNADADIERAVLCLVAEVFLVNVGRPKPPCPVGQMHEGHST